MPARCFLLQQLPFLMDLLCLAVKEKVVPEPTVPRMRNLTRDGLMFDRVIDALAAASDTGSGPRPSLQTAITLVIHFS